MWGKRRELQPAVCTDNECLQAVLTSFDDHLDRMAGGRLMLALMFFCLS
jgi:hypothetical protein